MDRRLLAALVLPLALTGCGGDGDEDSPADSSADGESPAASTGAADPAGDLSAEDAEAIEETILEFLVTGDCDLATDDYLRDIALFADDDASREEACSAWESVFSEPLFTKEDVVLTGLDGDGGVATIEVGSELVPDLTTLYELTRVAGTWLVSGDEYNTDGL